MGTDAAPVAEQGTERSDELEAWAEELTRREEALDAWESALRAEVQHETRPTLPAAPVASAVRHLQATGEFERDLDRCATGLGLEPQLLAGVLDGSVREVDLVTIRTLCEGLHCSPYDLWGVANGRRILHAYGPEHWPSYIEPLADRGPDLTFISRRVEQQSAELLRALSTEDRGFVPTVQEGGEIGHLELRSAVAASHSVDALETLIRGAGLDAAGAATELRWAGARLEDVVAVVVRIADSPAEGLEAVRDAWRIEDTHALRRLACVPTATGIAADRTPPAVDAAPLAVAGGEPQRSLIAEWAAVATLPMPASPDVLPPRPAS